jgi:hypothetical protein
MRDEPSIEKQGFQGKTTLSADLTRPVTGCIELKSGPKSRDQSV